MRCSKAWKQFHRAETPRVYAQTSLASGCIIGYTLPTFEKENAFGIAGRPRYFAGITRKNILATRRVARLNVLCRRLKAPCWPPIRKTRRQRGRGECGALHRELFARTNRVWLPCKPSKFNVSVVSDTLFRYLRDAARRDAIFRRIPNFRSSFAAAGFIHHGRI